MNKIMIAIILMMAAVTNVGAQAPAPIWEKSRTTSFNSFYSVMKEKGGVDAEGNLKMDVLCIVAHNAAVNQKLIAAEITSTKYCSAFKKLNGVFGETISPNMFKLAQWWLPAGDIVQKNSEKNPVVQIPEVKSGAVGASTVKKEEAPAPPKAKVKVEAAEKLTRLIERVEVRVPSNVDLGPINKTVASIKGQLTLLQSGNLTPQLTERISREVDAKILELTQTVNSMMTDVDQLKSRVVSLESGQSQLSSRLDNHDQLISPIGYGLISDVFGIEAANNYATSAKYLQFCLFGLLMGLTLLVYPWILRKSRMKFIKIKSSADRLEGKVNIISAQVAGMIGYTFETSVVTFSALSQMEIGSSIDLLLVATDGGENASLTLERINEDEVTIHGALRQTRSKTPLTCGLSKVVQGINRAIRDGRIEDMTALRAVA